MGGNQADSEYIARMQRAESVNQVLSKVLRDVIGKHPLIADEVRKELAIAFEIMNNGQPEYEEGEIIEDES
jgi:hypothetical protein